MDTDIAIAQAHDPAPITEIAATLGLDATAIDPYGHDKAKLTWETIAKAREARRGRLVLVTAMSPTSAGEGKSTVTIGLADALARRGHRAAVCLREPSMGPVFGRKGGATGGGYAQVVPMEAINFHFTGDMHAITTANNLMCACIDNHLYWGNELDLDPNTIAPRRCLDVNDRALRVLDVGRGVRADRDVRPDGFDITVASEIMAILCLATSIDDLKERLGRILIGYSRSGEPLTVDDLGITGALAAILADAQRPNLVQTLEGTPAFVHGGPFANIAHGCNSIMATTSALGLADVVVTEAGFGADLGAEKFLDIKCPAAGIAPSCAVLVATVRALKLHGGVAEADLDEPDVEALTRGLANLARHAATLQAFNVPVVVALNRFATDSDAEIEAVREAASGWGVDVRLTEVFARGGAGGESLAEAVEGLLDAGPADLARAYDDDDDLVVKLEKVARRCYGAAGVELAPKARDQLESLRRIGADKLPVCVAKTPQSFTDDPTVLGAPEDFVIHVRELSPRLGAGFVVCLTGSILTMPGLPRRPRACDMDVRDGVISGIG